MRQLTLILAFVYGVFVPCGVSAQSARTDSAATDTTVVISLLTCSPGQESYELYGHTAILVENGPLAPAVVYNYGVFDFETPNFTWRFILGECDYLLCPQSLASFLKQYADRGSSVTQQVLNLTPDEAARVEETLREESRPENRIYRYHIFKSNCTTRARDVIERCIDGEVKYPLRPRRHTYRTMLHEYTQGREWIRAGTDLLLGMDVDTLLTERDEMFAPLYMMAYADSAIIDHGRRRMVPLVREHFTLLAADAERQQAEADRQPSFPIAPAPLAWGLLAAGLVLSFFEWRRRRIVWPVDMLLLTIQGVVGIVLTFMALCSVHPAVASNWQVWVFNPIPLFFIYAVTKADKQRKYHVYHTFAVILLTIFLLLSFFIPQDFCPLTRPLALLLLSRAVVHILIFNPYCYRTLNVSH